MTLYNSVCRVYADNAGPILQRSGRQFVAFIQEFVEPADTEYILPTALLTYKMQVISSNTRRTSIIAFLIFAVVASYYLFPSVWVKPLIAIDRMHSGIKPGTVHVSGRPVFYIRGGSGPTMILLHGFGGNKEQRHGLSCELIDKFDVVAPDLVGFGETGSQSGDFYGIAAQAEKVRQFMHALNIERAHFVGSSMGGHIAAQLAADTPNSVMSLTLIEPHGVMTDEKTLFDMQIALGKIPLVATNPSEFEALVALAFEDLPFIPYPIYDHLRRNAIANSQAYSAIWDQVRREADALPHLMARVRAPTLLAWGDSQRIFHTSAIGVLQKANPKIRSVVFRNAGHLLMMEKPGAVAWQVKNFIFPIKSSLPHARQVEQNK